MPLMGFYGARIGLEKRNAFLKLLGVTIIAGVVSSSRKNIEVNSIVDFYNICGTDYGMIKGGLVKEMKRFWKVLEGSKKKKFKVTSSSLLLRTSLSYSANFIGE